MALATIATAPPLFFPAVPSIADAALYEVVDGQYSELPPMSTYAGVLASRLHTRLGVFVESRRCGQAVMEVLFGLDPASRSRRRPDVAFVSEERWPRSRPLPNTDPWPVVPDLAVEVVSPSDLAEAVRLKILEYFRHGVTQVWVVWPQARCVDVYESATLPRVLTADDTLDGGSILPGFSLLLREYFCEEPAANGAADAAELP
jgi:Uma2 family endonuclease